MAKLNTRFPVYSRLIALYPASYRKRYGDQMLQTLADMLDAAPSVSRRSVVWLRAVLDLPASIVAQQSAYAGNVLAHETPGFVRRNTLLSALFFAPFFVIAIVDDLDAHRFYHTWLWSSAVLLTWIVILPALGLLLSTVTLLAWMHGNRRSWWQSIRDVSHNWMMLLPILLGLGILFLVLFHDSVRCVTGNPIREFHNPRDTLRCIVRR